MRLHIGYTNQTLTKLLSLSSLTGSSCCVFTCRGSLRDMLQGWQSFGLAHYRAQPWGQTESNHRHAKRAGAEPIDWPCQVIFCSELAEHLGRAFQQDRLSAPCGRGHKWCNSHSLVRYSMLLLTFCCQIDGMISVLDTSDYSILWTVPNNPYDVMGAWVPRSLSAHVGDGQWLSGIQHLIRYGGFSLKKMLSLLRK